MKKFKEFIKEDANATLGNTGGMGAVIAAQPGSSPGEQGTKGSGDIGNSFAPSVKPTINLVKNKKKKRLKSFKK
jgi:hypothetical protein